MPNKKKWTQMTLNPLFYLAAGKCRERDSNPHNHFWSRDFKSLVSTIPPSRQPLHCFNAPAKVLKSGKWKEKSGKFFLSA